jgi:hypothetical protein
MTAQYWNSTDSDRPDTSWFTAFLDRIERWCEMSAGTCLIVESPIVAASMRDAVVTAAVGSGWPRQPSRLRGDAR